jgi:hypothetical protein
LGQRTEANKYINYEKKEKITERSIAGESVSSTSNKRRKERLVRCGKTNQNLFHSTSTFLDHINIFSAMGRYAVVVEVCWRPKLWPKCLGGCGMRAAEVKACGAEESSGALAESQAFLSAG